MRVDDHELSSLIIPMGTCVALKRQGKCNDGDCKRCDIAVKLFIKFMSLSEQDKMYVRSKTASYSFILSSDYIHKRYSFDRFLRTEKHKPIRIPWTAVIFGVIFLWIIIANL